MRPSAPFALIVGHNHSVLGGVRYDINTPAHLASIASGVGWTVKETDTPPDVSSLRLPHEQCRQCGNAHHPAQFMNELTVHPKHLRDRPPARGLISILERVWLGEHTMGDGTLYVVSGFANYNGGVRFFPVFRHHVEQCGKVVAMFSGSAQQHLTSRQVVRAMLECGADVHVVNRKRLMHVKSYGSKTSKGEMLVVTSGNFTGPGHGPER